MKHLLMFRRSFGLVFIMLLLTGLYACGEDEEQYTPPGLGVPVPVFELKREVYADPDIFDQPRVQFMWQGPERNRDEIWSVKIDGTDLRLAADEKLLYGGETKDMDILLHPVRSPDNRYILVQYSKPGDRFNVYLIDLEKNNKKYLLECRIWHAPWAGDSQSFFCGLDHDLKRYYLETGKTESIRHINNGIVYVQQNSEQIFKMEETGFSIWDFDGNELRKEELGDIHRTLHHINGNGKFMYFDRMESKTGSIINTNNINSEISVPVSLTPLLTNDGQYYLATGGVSKYDKESQTVKNIFTKFGGDKYNYEFGYSLGKFTLFNERINNGMQESRWNGSKKAD